MAPIPDTRWKCRPADKVRPIRRRRKCACLGKSSRPSALLPSPRQEAEKLADMAEEAAISRLYSGIHYRSDNEVGFKVGTRVGQVAVGVYQVPAP
jgi:hypothetical protein